MRRENSYSERLGTRCSVYSDAEVVQLILQVVWEDFDSKDVRMLLHIGVLVRKSDTEQDIRRIIETLMKYREGEEEYYD